MPLDEVLRLATRAAARDGDAQRSVRTHAKDVAPRARHAHELDRPLRRDGRRGSGLLGLFGGLKEWKVELHLAIDNNPE